MFCDGGMNAVMNSTLQGVLTTYFPTDAMRSQCSNVGLQYVHVEEVLNA